jgi:hypothetical protein
MNKAIKALLLTAIAICTLINFSSGWTFSIPQAVLLVLTDKSSYTYRDVVQISGDLWLGSEPVDGLVAVEVINPDNRTLVIRTVPAGTPAITGSIEILSVIPCDQLGNPKNNFVRGADHAHVNVTVKNNDVVTSVHVLLTVCTYDNDSTPILPEVMALETTIPPGGIVQFKPDIPLDSWVSTGTATFHVNVLSDWPKNGGYPYTAEKSATFNIVSTKTTSTLNYKQFVDSESEGTYHATFRLPPTNTTGAPFGTYTINASAYAQGYIAYASKTFVREFQIIGDINFDRKIDILDVVAVTSIYGSKSGDPKWDPRVDVQPSGNIDISDVVVVTSKYGQTY